MMSQARLCERVPFFARVTITPSGGVPPFEAHSFDISLAGVGLTSPRALAVGQVVSLAFHLPDGRGGQVAEMLPGRVVRARSDEGATSIGIQFLAPPDDRSTPVLAGKISRC
jgi:hypothetical protein